MTLLDSNVLIYASDPGSACGAWARRTIARGVFTGRGATRGGVVAPPWP